MASGGRFLKKCPIDVAAGHKRGEEERWERKKKKVSPHNQVSEDDNFQS